MQGKTLNQSQEGQFYEITSACKENLQGMGDRRLRDGLYGWGGGGRLHKVGGKYVMLLYVPVPPTLNCEFCAGIFKQSMGGQEPSRNRVVVPARRIVSLESVPGLLKSLKIRALYDVQCCQIPASLHCHSQQKPRPFGTFHGHQIFLSMPHSQPNFYPKYFLFPGRCVLERSVLTQGELMLCCDIGQVGT